MTDEESSNVPENEDEYLAEGDLARILEAKNKAVQALQTANAATSEAKIADLEYRVLVQHMFIKYELRPNDRIEDANGRIVRIFTEEPEHTHKEKEDNESE